MHDNDAHRWQLLADVDAMLALLDDVTYASTPEEKAAAELMLQAESRRQIEAHAERVRQRLRDRIKLDVLSGSFDTRRLTTRPEQA